MRRLIAALLAGACAASPAAADPLVERGRRVFQTCYACHSVDPAERGLPGPNLAGVVGRRAGAEAAFDYSPALKRAAAQGLTWDVRTLDRFLTDPEAVIPRTEMLFTGVRKPEDRRAVIAFLRAGR